MKIKRQFRLKNVPESDRIKRILFSTKVAGRSFLFLSDFALRKGVLSLVQLNGKSRVVRIAVVAAVICLVVFAAMGLYRHSQKNRMSTSVDFIMNTVVEQKLYGARSQEAVQAVSAMLRQVEQKVSLHLDGSEIDAVNRSAGVAPVAVSEDVFTMLKTAKEYSARCGGVFDLTIAPLDLLWGITSDSPRVPAQAEIQEALGRVDYQKLILDETAHTAYLTEPGMAIDLGGIAKGIAGGMVREVAREYGIENGYVSIGGNLTILGKNPENGQQFLFGVRDPRGNQNEYIATIYAPGKIMATSGDYERYFEQDGVRYHHILDPRTGYPARSDLISVTILTEDGGLADYLSTLFFILGRDAAMEHINDENLQMILVDKDFRVYYSQSLKGILQPNSEAKAYAFHES